MQIEKTDRRVKYTKMVLKNSFVNLLKQKPISKISIKEICADADINRATFYAHYSDQNDLLLQIENELIEDINIYLRSYSFTNAENTSVEMLKKIFEYIKKNAELCTILLGECGDISFQKKVMMIVGEQCISEWTMNKTIEIEDAEYIYFFTAIGSVGVIQKWLTEGMKKSPKQMAELILKIANSGLTAFY